MHHHIPPALLALLSAQGPLTRDSFSWGSIFNIHDWADPQEQLVGLIFTNISNTERWNIGDHFTVLTYQAIVR